MLCLSGFELCSRWVPLKCNNGLTQTSGGSRGGARGAAPPLFSDQTEARRTQKIFVGDPPPPYLRVWRTAPPSLSQLLDPAL